MSRIISARLATLAGAILWCSPATAQAAKPRCSITHDASGPLLAELEANGFAFPGYDDFCTKLKASNVSITIIHSIGVLDNRAYAWVSVSLRDRKTDILGEAYQSSTALRTPADTPTAQHAALGCLNDVLGTMAKKTDAYLDGLRANVQNVREKIGSASG